MRTLLQAETTTTTRPPAELYARWVDHDTWTDWDDSVASARLDGPLAVGSEVRFRPSGGPPLTFTIHQLEQDRLYTDAMRVPGATMLVAHRAAPTADGTAVSVTVTMDGPLTWLWAPTIGRSASRGIEGALATLVRLCESRT